MDEREDHSESKAKSSSSRSKSGNAAQSKKGGRFNYPHNNNSNNNKMAPRGPYNNPMMRGGPPYGPPPYGFMNNSYGPPPPHYPHPPHMPMPPYAGAPFPGQMGGPGMNGSGMNGPGMNGPGMKGPGYPHHHYHGPPYGMPPAYPQHVPSSYPHMGASSDSASITSKSSMNSKKKRTIDGMHGNLPSAYTFRRTDSNSSSASTLTTGNNTSMETNQTDESQHTTRDGSDSVSLNMDGMAFEDRYNHEQSNSQSSFHRRNHSVASTASSLSVCGFSLSSYEGQRGTLEGSRQHISH